MDKKLLLVTLLSFIIFFANLGGTSIYILDEAKNAACAMEMHQRGTWVVPTFNGELRFDKPPLHYFFMRSAYSILGITPYAARFFSAVMGVLLVIALYTFTKRNVSKPAAFFASLAMVTSLQGAVQFHMAVPDPYLIFFMTLGLFLFYDAWKQRKRHLFYVSYLCLALAALAKGPVALVLPASTIFIFLVTQKQFSWTTIRALHIPEAILILFIVTLPWYWLVHEQTSGLWTEQFFFKHNVSRFTKTMEGHGGFPLASLVLVFAALVPNSFFLPQALRTAWRSRTREPFIQFALAASIVIVGFFALSRTILPSYIGPALPFVCVLLGFYFRKSIRKRKPAVLPSAVAYAFAACLFPLGAFIAFTEDKSLMSLSSQAGWFVLFPLSALAGLVFAYRKKVKEMVFAYASGSALFLLVFFHIIFPRIDALNPVSQSLSILKDKANVRYYVGAFNPAYVFALQHTLLPLSKEQAIERLRLDKESIILSQTRHSKSLPDSCILFKGKDLFEKPVTVVFRGK